MGRKTWRHGVPHEQNCAVCGNNLAKINMIYHFYAPGQLEYSSIDKMAKYDWSMFRNYVAFLADRAIKGFYCTGYAMNLCWGISLKIINLRLQQHLPGANELIMDGWMAMGRDTDRQWAETQTDKQWDRLIPVGPTQLAPFPPRNLHPLSVGTRTTDVANLASINLGNWKFETNSAPHTGQNDKILIIHVSFL